MSASGNAVEECLASNKAWASSTAKATPDFFKTLSAGQAPQILWLGCSDSRVPESTLLGVPPGTIFTHRNIANILNASDLSFLSVLTFAVQNLKVSHVVVCGHSSCGGVAGSLGKQSLGVLDAWLAPLRALRVKHADELEALPEGPERAKRLGELNVLSGVDTVKSILEGWPQSPSVWGMVFELGSGELRVLDTADDAKSSKVRANAFGLNK